MSKPSAFSEVIPLLLRAFPWVYPDEKSAYDALALSKRTLLRSLALVTRGAGYCMTIDEDGEIEVWLSPKAIKRLLQAAQ